MYVGFAYICSLLSFGAWCRSTRHSSYKFTIVSKISDSIHNSFVSCDFFVHFQILLVI